MEFVFVIPRSELFKSCTPHGLQLFEEASPTATSSVPSGAVGADNQESSGEAIFRDRLERYGFFVEREYAERSPQLKQVIPYTLVVRRPASAPPEVFRLMRTKAGGEARLHNKLSIGVGGHIEPIDLPQESDLAPAAGQDQGSPAEGTVPRSLRDPIPFATRREVLEEELQVEGPWRLRAVGLINDDTNPVGAVHVGLVQLLEVSGAVSVRETEQLVGRFAPLPELLDELAEGANYETWSSLILPSLGSVLAAGDLPSHLLTPPDLSAPPAAKPHGISIP